MPYVITVSEPFDAAVHVYRPAFTRHAVAALERARKSAQDVMLDRARNANPAWQEGSNAANWQQAGALPESGGTIELPDGTVIEVEPVSWPQLAASVGMVVSDRIADAMQDEILDAYNAN